MSVTFFLNDNLQKRNYLFNFIFSRSELREIKMVAYALRVTLTADKSSEENRRKHLTAILTMSVTFQNIYQ